MPIEVMPSAREALASRVLRFIVAGAGTLAILVYGFVAFNHLRYPHELEWMEGGMVDEVARLVAGGKIYVAPTLDYAPFIYGPLWFHVAALFCRLFGVGFFAVRLVSVLASFGALALIARIVLEETRDRTAAIAAAGLFAAMYPAATSIYDLARVDSLFIFLVLGALYLVRFRVGLGATVAAAALFALAFLTKQSAPIIFGPAALHLLLTDRRRGIVFTVAGAALMGGSVLAYDAASHGWFWYYVVALPAKHALVKGMLRDFWIELFMLLGIAAAFGAAYFVFTPRGEARRFYAFATTGMLACGLVGRIHVGGWPNVLTPAFAMLGVLLGLGLHSALGRISLLPPTRARRLAPLILAAAALQLGLRAYNPLKLVAPPRHQVAWEALLHTVRDLDGDVYVSAHGWVGPRAGKRAHAHQMALIDVLRAGAGTGEQANAFHALRREIVGALKAKRFSAIVLDDTWLPLEQLESSYEKQAEIAEREDLGPIIGFQAARPQAIWVPRR